jgi:hypothetical protein
MAHVDQIAAVFERRDRPTVDLGDGLGPGFRDALIADVAYMTDVAYMIGDPVNPSPPTSVESGAHPTFGAHAKQILRIPTLIRLRRNAVRKGMLR